MRPKSLARLLDSYIAAARDGQEVPAIFIESEPGVGKTSLVRQACTRTASHFHELHLLFREPVDFSGVPSVVKGRTVWNPPEDLVPKDLPDHGVLLLEEIAQLEPPMQKAIGPVCLEKRFGNVPLPPRWLVVATGNRVQDRAGAFRLLSHLRNRIVRVKLDCSLEDFLEWGFVSGRIDNRVRLFLDFRKDKLLCFSPDKDQQDATPRSWEMASQVLQFTPKDLRRESVAGCVGDGPAAEFMAFLEVWESLPDMKKLLADPEGYKLPDGKNLSVIYATAGALAETVINAPAKTQEAAARYAVRLPKEYATLFMQCAVTNLRMLATREAKEEKQKRQFLGLPTVQQWIMDNRDILEASMR